MATSVSPSRFILEWLQSTRTSDDDQNVSTHQEIRLCDRNCSQTQNKPRNTTPPINFDSYTSIQPEYEDQDDHDFATQYDPVRSLIQPSENSDACTRHEQNLYARRPRWKTKIDKYDFHSTRVRKSQRGKRRRRQETSGTALLHRYSAENVASSRLTLRPTSNLGLFGKGRVSSGPKGLQDLAFCNIKVLGQHHPGRVIGENIPASKSRTAGNLQHPDLSQFFVAKSTDIAQAPAAGAIPSLTPRRRDASQIENLLEPHVPPFLGFGQSPAGKIQFMEAPAVLAPSTTLIDSAEFRAHDVGSQLRGLVQNKSRDSKSSDLLEPTQSLMNRSCLVQNHDVETEVRGDLAGGSVDGRKFVQRTNSEPLYDRVPPAALVVDLFRLIKRWQNAPEASGLDPGPPRSTDSLQKTKHRPTRNGPSTDYSQSHESSDHKGTTVNIDQFPSSEQAASKANDEESKISESTSEIHKIPYIAPLKHLTTNLIPDEPRSVPSNLIQRLQHRQPSLGPGVSPSVRTKFPLDMSVNLVNPTLSIYEDQARMEAATNLISHVSKRFSRKDIASSSSLQSYTGTDITNVFSSLPVSSPTRNSQAKLVHGSSSIGTRHTASSIPLSLNQQLLCEGRIEIQPSNHQNTPSPTPRTALFDPLSFLATPHFGRRQAANCIPTSRRSGMQASSDPCSPKIVLGPARTDEDRRNRGLLSTNVLVADDMALENFWTPQKLY